MNRKRDEQFVTELRDLLRKYNAHIAASAECSHEERISVYFRTHDERFEYEELVLREWLSVDVSDLNDLLRRHTKNE